MQQNLIIGIGGGTASGKTTLANRIISKLKKPDIQVLKMDSYYKSHPELSQSERDMINFDHPNAFDFELIIQQMKELKNGNSINIPQWNYKTHLRKPETLRVPPSNVIILEGILIFENPNLRKILDIKLFVDTDPDIRILRRIKRDMEKRGRTFTSIYKQYFDTVKPMHEEFVEPSKKHADIIVPKGGHNLIAIDMIVAKIELIISKKNKITIDL